MGLDAALDGFWEAADAQRLGIDAIQVAAGNGRHGERRRIDDIRRDVFSVSKTVTSLAIGMLEHAPENRCRFIGWNLDGVNRTATAT